MKNKPLPHSHWRHYKSTGWVDHTYEVIGIAKHSETGEDMVLYRPLYTVSFDSWAFWYEYIVRPLSLWFDIVEYQWKKGERFTQIW
jgi:hypothetical protein